MPPLAALSTNAILVAGGSLAVCLGLLNPGDEVVVFEPFYDAYRADVAMAGGVCRFVALGGVS